MRTCRVCNESKDESEFYRNENKQWGKTYKYINTICRPCDNARARAYYWKNRDKIKERQNRWRNEDKEKKAHRRWVNKIRRVYGITEEDYLKLLAAQGGKCRLCGGAPDEDKRLVVDHCHVTGRVRWLIHSDCNLALGMIEKRGISSSAIDAYFRSQLEMVI